jgi:hypothetical protein
MVKYRKCKKYCDWEIGAGISGKNDKEIGIFLCCKKCSRIVEAYYKENSKEGKE